MDKEGKAIVKQEDISQVINNYLFASGSNLTKQQKLMFLQIAKAFNLNPFKREIYAISFKGQLSIITGYQTYIQKANQTGLLVGWKVEEVREEDKLIGAKITIYRKDWKHPFEWFVSMQEFSRNTPIWKQMPSFMIKKVAIAQGFRLCFPEYLGGMPYIKEELGVEEEPMLVEVKPVFDKDKFLKSIERLNKKEEVLKEFGLKSFDVIQDRELATKVYKRLQEKQEEVKQEEEVLDLSTIIKHLSEKQKKRFFALCKFYNVDYEELKVFLSLEENKELLDKSFIKDLLDDSKQLWLELANQISIYKQKLEDEKQVNIFKKEE